jgi:predicted DNA-binding transcriptional regulator AlpA
MLAPVDVQPSTWLDIEGVAAELGLSHRATIDLINTYVTSGFPEGHVISGHRIRWSRDEVRAWRDAPREPAWQFGDEWPGPEVPARDATGDEIPGACLGLVKVATKGGWLTRVTYARGTVPNAQGRPGDVIATTALRFRRPPPEPRKHPVRARGYALWRQRADKWTYEGGALTGVPAGLRYHKLDKDGIERLVLQTTTLGVNPLSSAALRLVLGPYELPSS